MAPDRILAAAERLQDEASALHDDVQNFKRWQRVKNWLLVVALVSVALLAGQNRYERLQSDHKRCESANTSRLAIRDADKARGDGLIEVIRPFVRPDSVDGKRFLASLEADNERISAELAKKLPVVAC